MESLEWPVRMALVVVAVVPDLVVKAQHPAARTMLVACVVAPADALVKVVAGNGGGSSFAILVNCTACCLPIHAAMNSPLVMVEMVAMVVMVASEDSVDLEALAVHQARVPHSALEMVAMVAMADLAATAAAVVVAPAETFWCTLTDSLQILWVSADNDLDAGLRDLVDVVDVVLPIRMTAGMGSTVTMVAKTGLPNSLAISVRCNEDIGRSAIGKSSPQTTTSWVVNRIVSRLYTLNHSG